MAALPLPRAPFSLLSYLPLFPQRLRGASPCLERDMEMHLMERDMEMNMEMERERKKGTCSSSLSPVHQGWNPSSMATQTERERPYLRGVRQHLQQHRIAGGTLVAAVQAVAVTVQPYVALPHLGHA